jgi:DNA-binding HxlR family transcriptional regulator
MEIHGILNATWYTIGNQVGDISVRQKPVLCSVETTTRILGGRWKPALLEHLFQGEKRFSELKRCVPGITQKTLSEQLRELQCAGIVARKVFPDTPPRVVYSVTLLGETLRPLLDAMCKWGKSHSAAMALKKLQASEQEK